MTASRGLGALPSPPDDRDFDADTLLAALPTLALPAHYSVRRLPDPLDQGNTPQCVAYSAAALKAWADKRDQGHWFHFNEHLFFTRIGGGPDGAYVRDAMREMLHTGYPTQVGHADRHRIAAYYRVKVEPTRIKRAIRRLGPVIVSMDWANSWYTPRPGGILPRFDVRVGGHAIMAIGWNSHGLRLRNSWGADWGRHGNCTLPWDELDHVWEVWKTIDERMGAQVAALVTDTPYDREAMP